jgi:hypothetical protein
MNQARSGARANRRGMVKEFFAEATLPVLISVLVNRGIDPYAIIAIVEMHGQTTASPTPPQFRVSLTAV